MDWTSGFRIPEGKIDLTLLKKTSSGAHTASYLKGNMFISRIKAAGK
jgi:hypothetical protein